jgi:hypothetical protein
VVLNLEEEEEAQEAKLILAEVLRRTIGPVMTGSTFMITILQIRVLTSLVLMIPSPLPIFLTDPRVTTDSIPGQGMYGQCDQKDHDTDYPS